MRCIPALLFLLLAFAASTSVNATTWDDISRLEAHKHMQQSTGVPVATQSTTVLHRLSDGRQVNLRDWKIVLFMSSSCTKYNAFDPVLNAIAKETGFSVFSYTLDRRGDASWPQAMDLATAVR